MLEQHCEIMGTNILHKKPKSIPYNKNMSAALTIRVYDLKESAWYLHLHDHPLH